MHFQGTMVSLLELFEQYRGPKAVPDTRMRILDCETYRMVIHNGYGFLNEFSWDDGRLFKRFE